MRLKVLGCSGGIGGGQRTTSFLVGRHTLIDAGTGLGDLSVAELVQIDHLFLTHSHLDHIAMLPLLVDTVGAMRRKPLLVYASASTLAILSEHIFNWKVWPDFRVIPDASAPFLRFVPFELGDSIQPETNLTITALPALHTVPAVGYQLDSGRYSIVFTGDTTVNDAFWPIINGIGNLKALIIETAFCNHERALAEASYHLCPAMLASELQKLAKPAEIHITHLKPGEIELTMQEIGELAAAFRPKMLKNGQVLEF
ncbi:MBL fold metallo-hydrolase [Chitinimonas sp. BJB300]|uniref:MBL fold metallo-hydrolase n=1 Tax=Chitinimonas sp. BJB300 TaxID=1559339 RepID=UPI000C0E19E3|nr:3',5'-cyclic-nucleotide phosphodiesterase [Chitinimonas sp. BJB300]PHV10376.1 3',5'-cyclic-nucleotide phosphodiesterase [Chitinimonas sp. BJB300]TSJ87684.1 3',5'-cyclic-nucleotide phosphodiesterase [Chitinimonas sp. BJB300]